MLTRRVLSLVLAASIALMLPGCTERLRQIDNWFKTYAPLVGENLILIGDILVRAECSPTSQVVGAAAIKILRVVAKTYDEADWAASALEANAAVAAELCPAVAAIRTSVGQVPPGQPTQIVHIAPPLVRK